MTDLSINDLRSMTTEQLAEHARQQRRRLVLPAITAEAEVSLADLYKMFGQWLNQTEVRRTVEDLESTGTIERTTTEITREGYTGKVKRHTFRRIDGD